MTLCSDKHGIDKLLHLLLGGIIVLVVGILFAHVPPHIPWLTVAVALTAVVTIAIAWEFYRKRKLPANHICIWDILWSLAGGVLFCWLPWLEAFLLARNG